MIDATTMKNLILAIQFLTIIPIGKSIAYSASDFHKIVAFFPLVGLIQGLILLFIELVLGQLFHPDLCIAFILLTYVMTNGGFHLDALADTFDGLAVRGDKEKKLSVMKDSSVGAIGVIAIVFTLAIKYLSIKSVSNLLPLVYYSSLLLMPVISKWSMVIALYHGVPAKQDGLGSLLVGKASNRSFIFATFLLICLFGLILSAPNIYIPQGQVLFFTIIMILIYFLVRGLILFYKKHFGGLTGDTVGSISEITDVIFLIMVILWSRLYIS
ncbi:MAG TPA: adenosylcobinamide-GDP ribazoletransferase [Nitrospirae bacterium]|nr:adenosylcobinamide-GDP ribazoletransferase [Nitrospirota bacterium]